MPGNQTATTTVAATPLAAMDSSENTLTFYDIILDPTAFPFAPNPWKTR